MLRIVHYEMPSRMRPIMIVIRVSGNACYFFRALYLKDSDLFLHF